MDANKEPRFVFPSDARSLIKRHVDITFAGEKGFGAGLLQRGHHFSRNGKVCILFESPVRTGGAIVRAAVARIDGDAVDLESERAGESACSFGIRGVRDKRGCVRWC